MYNNDKAFKELVNCYHEIGLLLRKCDSITALGKICPATVNTRWVYIFDVLKFIDGNMGPVMDIFPEKEKRNVRKF
jgi:hypothetical protein